MAKWSYIANAVFRIVQNHGEKVYLVGFTGAIAPPPWIGPWAAVAVGVAFVRALSFERDFSRT